MNNLINEIPIRIIEEQELIIGPLAWDLAGRTAGLQVNRLQRKATISGQPSQVVDSMVMEYERLFGLASLSVCKDAAKDILKKLSSEDIPTKLK